MRHDLELHGKGIHIKGVVLLTRSHAAAASKGESRVVEGKAGTGHTSPRRAHDEGVALGGERDHNGGIGANVPALVNIEAGDHLTVGRGVTPHREVAAGLGLVARLCACVLKRHDEHREVEVNKADLVVVDTRALGDALPDLNCIGSPLGHDGLVFVKALGDGVHRTPELKRGRVCDWSAVRYYLPANRGTKPRTGRRLVRGSIPSSSRFQCQTADGWATHPRSGTVSEQVLVANRGWVPRGTPPSGTTAPRRTRSALCAGCGAGWGHPSREPHVPWGRAPPAHSRRSGGRPR